MKNIPPEQLGKVLDDLSNNIIKDAETLLFETATEIRDEMAGAGKPVTYPIQWDSDKQRKAFFATDGFGAGIPTRRTGAYGSAYYSKRITDGAEVGNPLSHARYIGGSADKSQRQSRIHRGRWKVFRDVAARVIANLPKNIRTRLRIRYE